MATVSIPVTQLDEPIYCYLVSIIKYGRSDIQLSEEDQEELEQEYRKYKEFAKQEQRRYRSMLKAAKELEEELNRTRRL